MWLILKHGKTNVAHEACNVTQLTTATIWRCNIGSAILYRKRCSIERISKKETSINWSAALSASPTHNVLCGMSIWDSSFTHKSKFKNIFYGKTSNNNKWRPNKKPILHRLKNTFAFRLIICFSRTIYIVVQRFENGNFRFKLWWL